MHLGTYVLLRRMIHALLGDAVGREILNKSAAIVGLDLGVRRRGLPNEVGHACGITFKPNVPAALETVDWRAGVDRAACCSQTRRSQAQILFRGAVTAPIPICRLSVVDKSAAGESARQSVQALPK